MTSGIMQTFYIMTTYIIIIFIVGLLWDPWHYVNVATAKSTQTPQGHPWAMTKATIAEQTSMHKTNMHVNEHAQTV